MPAGMSIVDSLLLHGVAGYADSWLGETSDFFDSKYMSSSGIAAPNHGCILATRQFDV